MDPEPIDPATLDWDREVAASRGNAAPGTVKGGRADRFEPTTGRRPSGMPARLGLALAAVLLSGGLAGALLFPRASPSGATAPPPVSDAVDLRHEVAGAERTTKLAALRKRQLELHRELEAKWDALRVVEDEQRRASREVESLDDQEARRAAAREATEAVRRELLTREIAELKAEAAAASGYERSTELQPLYWELVRTREWNAKSQAKEPVSHWADGSVEGPGGLLPPPKHRDFVAERLRSVSEQFGPNSRIAQGWARALAEIEERLARTKAGPVAPDSDAMAVAESRVAELAPTVEAARAALDKARVDLRAVEDEIAGLGEKP